MYVSHPNSRSIPRDQGESTFHVISYNEPPKFRIDDAFKDAVSIIGNHKEDCGKYVLLITNRFQAPHNHQYRKGFLINEIRDHGCKMCVFGVGQSYDKISLKSIAEEYGAKFVHLDDVSSLGSNLKEIVGEQNGKQ